MPHRTVLCRVFWLTLFLSSIAHARELRLEMAIDHNATIQVFFGRTESDFSEANSTTKPLVGDGQFHELHFVIPAWDKLALRLDPGSEPGMFRIRHAQLIDDRGNLIGSIPNADFLPAQQVAIRGVLADAEATEFVIPARSNDPILVVNNLALLSLLDRSHRVSRQEFLWVFLAGAVAVLFGVVVCLKWCATSVTGEVHGRLIVAAGIVLLVAGIRLTILSDKVSWAPYLDQFEGELAMLIRPFEQGLYHWADFAAPHNDHRILTTRIASLAAFLINGEWDNRVLAVANCFLQGLCIGWFALFALRELRVFCAVLVVLSAVATAFLVNDWANIISGFQIQFHFILLSSLVALTLLPNARFGSAACWAGFAAGVFAAASMGSGFLALAAAIPGILLRLWIDRKVSAPALAVLVLSAGVVIFAWFTRAIFPALDDLRAKNVTQWLYAVWTYGAWPLPAVAWWFAVLWLPWAVLTVRTLRRRTASAFEMFVVSLGVWLLLEVAALSWGRAAYAPTMSSRYTGVLEWCSVLAIASTTVLCSSAGKGSTARFINRRILPSVIAAALIAVLVWQSHTFFSPQFREFVSQVREHEARLGTFMRYDDPRVFSAVEFPHKPYPFDERLVFLMRDPSLRAVMPAPLRRERFRLSDPVAFAKVVTGPLTQIARFLLRVGPLVTLVGLALICWIACRALIGRFRPHLS